MGAAPFHPGDLGDDASVTVKKTNDVLRVGEFERTFDDELIARYEIPKLPDGPRRTG